MISDLRKGEADAAVRMMLTGTHFNDMIHEIVKDIVRDELRKRVEEVALSTLQEALQTILEEKAP